MTTTRAAYIARLTPVAMRGYQRQWLGGDILAGLTLAAVGIPEVMGYTTIAKTPLVTGLYTILIPLALFALLGASRLLVVGGDSATAAVLAAGLGTAGLATPGSDRWVALCSMTALITGLLLILARLLRLGLVGDFLSGAALVGLFTGIGIQVACDQIPQLLGIRTAGGNWFVAQWQWLTSLDQIAWSTAMYAAVTVALIAGCKRFAPRIPGSLLAVVGLLAFAWATDAGRAGVAMVGTVPGGLPSITLPPGISWHDVTALVPIAVSCLVLVIAQSAATSRRVAAAAGERPDVNRDLVGLAAANLGAGLSGTFVVNGSPTKTQVLTQAKGRTQLANLVVVVAVIVVLTFLTGVLAHLPKVVLAGVVFMIGVSLMDPAGLRRIARHSRVELAIALATMVAAFTVSITTAIVLAVVLSLADVVAHQYRAPADLVVPRQAGGYTYTAATPGQESEPGLVIFRFGADIFFANATSFVDRVEALVRQAPHPVRWVIVDADSISEVDYSASITLAALAEFVRQRGIRVVLARPSPQLLDQLSRYGVGQDLAIQTYADLDSAVAAFRTSAGTAPAPDQGEPHEQS